MWSKYDKYQYGTGTGRHNGHSASPAGPPGQSTINIVVDKKSMWNCSSAFFFWQLTSLHKQFKVRLFLHLFCKLPVLILKSPQGWGQRVEPWWKHDIDKKELGNNKNNWNNNNIYETLAGIHKQQSPNGQPLQQTWDNLTTHSDPRSSRPIGKNCVKKWETQAG